MPPGHLRILVALLVAIAITGSMEFSGLSAFSALALCPLMLVLWKLDGLSRREMGFRWAEWNHYGLAILYPIVVMGLIFLVAAFAGAVDISGTDSTKMLLNLALVAGSTVLIAIVTEEGFFRGWLWGALARHNNSLGWLVLWTGIAFAAWHVPAVVAPTDFAVPPSQLPIFLSNAFLLGAAWGLLRALSGSIIVSSVSHGVWNGLAYVLFGFGTRPGALGIENTAFYGPEVGILGLGLNLVGVLGLWWLTARSLSRHREASEKPA